MDGLWNRMHRLVGIVVGVLLAGHCTARADLADVYLRNGLCLRADVTVTDDAVILRNAAGEARLPRADVARIVPINPTTGEAESQPATHPAAEPATQEAAGARAEKPLPGELPPAPLLSKRDLQRLKLHELVLEGTPENVHVQFEHKNKQRDLPADVLDELHKRPDFKPAWAEVLTRGQPPEKLQLIVRETGMRHADRIDITSDPEVFDIFRRRVVPLVNNSCARAGCHAGTTARAFRLPIGSKAGEAYGYAVFALLDQMQGRQGPVIDRESPEDSLLLTYMLPQEDNDRGHPPVGRGPSFKPVIWGRDDPQYRAVVDWIKFLVRPRPDYDLEYKNPYVYPVGVTAPEPTGEVAPPATAEPASQPTTVPEGPEPERK